MGSAPHQRVSRVRIRAHAGWPLVLYGSALGAFPEHVFDFAHPARPTVISADLVPAFFGGEKHIENLVQGYLEDPDDQHDPRARMAA